MKKLLVLITAILVLFGCNGQKMPVKTSTEKKNVPFTQIIYSTNSRGFFQEIIIENQQIFIHNERNTSKQVNPIVISNKDWQEFVALVNNINLQEFPKLKAPTEKRFYDGAAIANLSINISDKSYQSASFDNGFPPKEIEKIVQKITSYAAKK